MLKSPGFARAAALRVRIETKTFLSNGMVKGGN